MKNKIRTGVYGVLKYKNKILVIKKSRGPFKGMYDLPGGKIEHFEKHKKALGREIKEETGLLENDFEIKKLLTVKEDFVKHIWKQEEINEHIIGIIYLVEITKNNIDLDFMEKGGDAGGLKLISVSDKTLPKTNILKKVILEIT